MYSGNPQYGVVRRQGDFACPESMENTLAASGGICGSVGDPSNWYKEEQLDKALQTVELMEQQGILLSKDIIYGVLQGCAKQKDSTAARRIHSFMVSSRLDSVSFLGDHLIRLFDLCGSLLEVNQVFCKISKPSVYTWNGVISAHVRLGESDWAVKLYYKMQQEGIKPDKILFLSILKACSNIKAIEQGRLIYDKIIRDGLESDAFVGSSLVDMYAKCSSLEEARKVFDKLLDRTVVSWSAMIAGYVQNGHALPAFRLFERMQEEQIKPDNFMFSCILKACGNAKDLELGRRIHGQIRKSGLNLDVVTGNALVDMYFKCGSLEEAHEVFNKMPSRNVVSWGSMIGGYAQHGLGYSALSLFENMQGEGIKPERVIYLCVLKACGGVGVIGHGRLIHDQIIRNGLTADLAIGNTLVDMYAKCQSLREAQKVFEKLQKRNVVSWGAMIAAYSLHECGADALQLFERMQEEGTNPDDVMLSCILKSCGSMGAIQQGRVIHDLVLRSGLQSDVVIGNTLVDMYAKCASLEEAYKVFDNLQNRNTVSWGAIIGGYAQQGHGSLALSLLEKMEEEGIMPDKAIFLCALKACSSIGDLKMGEVLHKNIIKSGFVCDSAIGNALVDMYANCGDTDEALRVFSELSVRDEVSWGALIAGYAQQDDCLSALELFEKMQQEGIEPNAAIFPCILKACGSVGSIGHGKLIHDEVIRTGLESDIVIGNSLIDMYMKCRRLVEARYVFNKMLKRDLVSWNTIIAGYAESGNCGLASQCLEDMQRQGLKPGSALFVSILAACSHAGLLEEGRRFYKSMIEEYCITPCDEHYNCMVDLLGRSGQLKEARNFIQTMPSSLDLIGWTSLLSSSRVYGDVELGRHCFDQVVQLDPDNASGFMLMSKIYANASMWEDVKKLQGLQKSTGVLKKPGMAWIEVETNFCQFLVGSKGHPQSNEIYCKMDKMGKGLKLEGYVPQLGLIVETESLEEDALCGQI